VRLTSTFKPLCKVALPFLGRQRYMHTFDTRELRMADGFEDYRNIVGELCEAASYSGVAHMTVDEKVIAPGMSQRRPGAHIDGRFMVSENKWGAGWLHYCNNISRSAVQRMAVIVAASVPGCIVYPGEFDGAPKEDGDLEHIRPQFQAGRLLCANMGYWLSPDCVHESIRFQQTTQRTFLRIALDT
jgi:hypothetical protein